MDEDITPSEADFCVALNLAFIQMARLLDEDDRDRLILRLRTRAEQLDTIPADHLGIPYEKSHVKEILFDLSENLPGI